MYTNDRFTGKKILKSPLKLIGAKTKIRDILYQYFPYHQYYLEPFMGTGGILIGKNRTSFEYISDTNEYAINFFKVLQSEPDEFWMRYQQELEALHKYGKASFVAIRTLVTDPDITNVSRAVYFYLITKVCMNGIWRLNRNGECNSSYCGQTNARGFMDQKWFNAIISRIQDMHFQNCDYRDTLSSANKCLMSRPFVFLDPPYSRCKTTYNGQGWKDEHFIELQESLEDANFRWLLTINDNEFIRDLFKKYEMISHDVHYSCSQTNAGRGKRPELLIANYSFRNHVNP